MPEQADQQSTTPVGLLNMAADDYHADNVANVPTLSASIATILCQQTPMHAQAAHPKLNGNYLRDEKAHLDVGTVAHAILLQGMDIVEVIHTDNFRTDAAKEAREEARAAGKVPMLAKTMVEVELMVAAVRDQLADFDVEPPLLTDGHPETTLVWNEPSGVVCRARLDWLNNDLTAIDDLKTTGRSADPRGFERRLYDHGYDVKAAFYIRGVQELFGETPVFRWLVVETAPPYAVSVVTPSSAVLTIGRKKVAFALNLWRECLRTGAWPGWPAEVAVAELPDFEEARWLRRELEAVA